MTICSMLAYLDPGTGSIVLQFLIGGALSIALATRIFWRRIKTFFTGKKDEADAADDSHESESLDD